MEFEGNPFKRVSLNIRYKIIYSCCTLNGLPDLIVAVADLVRSSGYIEFLRLVSLIVSLLYFSESNTVEYDPLNVLLRRSC